MTPNNPGPASVSELGLGSVPDSPLGVGFPTGQLSSPADIPEGDLRRHQRSPDMASIDR